jgi:hypothetical protein
MKEGSMKRATARALAFVAAFAVSAAVGAATLDKAQRLQSRPLTAAQKALALGERASIADVGTARIDPSLAGASGRQRVIVRLATPGVAQGAASREAVRAQQAALLDRILASAPGARQTGAVQLVLNAIFLDVDARDLAAIGRDANVSRVAPVGDYRRDLADTVPYIGAKTVQQLGYSGARIRVAVLDAGIDYTHAAFGGPGTFAAYQAAYGSDRSGAKAATLDGLFPTSKVVGGYDFVGEAWPAGERSEDPDPIAAPDVPTDGYCTADCYGGHGTHVADIIGGRSGVAPGVRLYAVKVCAAYATNCNGEALMLGMEYAVDPNGDGRTNDRVDIVNMSLGSGYGQPFDDDLSAAVDGATQFGTLTVASAGNSGDKPYVTGSPAAALTALSVAQTAMPKATLPLMQIAGSTPRPAVAQTWSPALAAPVSGPVYTYATSAGNTTGKALGCADAAGTNPYAAGELAGRIVLVNRGQCSASIKISNLAAAGATLGIIGFVNGEAPFAFAFGGGTPNIPSYAISLADANAIRGGATVTFDPGVAVPLAGSLASTSSRGPGSQGNTVKPEIGAPGESVSASSGTGTGTASFGGTSGAAPMVAGAAALLKSARPGLSPLELKQILINSAETNVRAPSVAGGIVPDIQAPVSRIGGGEVNVARALASPVAIWAVDATGRGGLGFGFVDAAKTQTLRRTVAIQNYRTTPITLDVAGVPGEHADGDAATAAVGISTVPRVTIPGRATRTIQVQLTIDAARLRGNSMNAGSLGNNPVPLTRMEYDGYLVFTEASGATAGAKYQLPWHVLPRLSADVRLAADELDIGPDGTGVIELENRGAGAAQYAAYSLLGRGRPLPPPARGGQSPNPSIRAVGVNTFDATGVCDAGFAMEFGVVNRERQTLPMAVSNVVYIDLDADGTDDYAVLNRDFSFNNITDGRQLAWSLNLATGMADAFFYVTHPTNAANMSLLVCGEQLGLGFGDLLSRRIRVNVVADDFYFGGNGGTAGPFDITPLGEKYVVLGTDTPANSAGSLEVLRFEGGATNDDQGVLLFTNAPRSGNNGGATERTEALVIKDGSAGRE